MSEPLYDYSNMQPSLKSATEWTDEDIAYAFMENTDGNGELTGEGVMAVIRTMRSDLADRIKRLETKVSDMTDELTEVEQTLGKALGYPYYSDDQKNFPGAVESDGVCIGDHVAVTIAGEAVQKIQNLKTELIHARDGYMQSLANRENWPKEKGERENE